MKKVFLILPFIFLIILTTSCSKDKIIIDKNKITDISFKDIVIKKEDFNSLIPIINKVSDYELFLKKAYLEISKYTNLERVDWLLK